MTEHEKLVQNARDAINNLFSDTSVDQDETLIDLSSIRDEIDNLIESVQTDLLDDNEDMEYGEEQWND